MGVPWLRNAFRNSLLLLVILAFPGCSEESDSGDADFGGFWDFDLTIVGAPCPGDESGMDCFAIQQTGLSLLIVDAAKGNLRGTVDGRNATISRESPEGSVFLSFRMNADARSLTGSAVEADSVRGCTTRLDIEGTRRSSRCGSAAN